jgi:excisionase family DNA binding protein
MSDRLCLRVKEAAKVLGMSPRWLWQQARNGRIPHVRLQVGKKAMLLFPVDLLRDWLHRNARREGGAAVMFIENLLALLAARGCKPRKTGSGWISRCPAHEDREPSLSVGIGGADK